MSDCFGCIQLSMIYYPEKFNCAEHFLRDKNSDYYDYMILLYIICSNWKVYDYQNI